MPLPSNVVARLKAMMQDAGATVPDEAMMTSMHLTNVPEDDFLTQVYLRRAEAEASAVPENYKCWACGKTFDKADDWVEHFQEHLVDFLAGMSPQLTEEELDHRVKDLHPSIQEEAKEVLRKNMEKRS